MNLEQIGNVHGLPEAELALLNDLVSVWRRKRRGNELKIRYYEMRNAVRDLGIAIPDPLKNRSLVVGWPAKAVDCLAIRSRFDGFTFGDNDDHGLKAVLDDNQQVDLNRTLNLENEINDYRKLLKGKNVADIENQKYSYQMGVHYMDVVNDCEKLGDYVVNVVEAHANKKFST